MIDNNLDAGKPSRHILQHRHLVWKNIVIEDRAAPFGFPPQWVVIFRIEPSRLRMVNRAETKALETVLLHPVAKPLDDLRVLGI